MNLHYKDYVNKYNLFKKSKKKLQSRSKNSLK